MLDAQPLGDRAVQIARAEPQFVRQQLGGGIEIGEMVAPALDLAPHQIERIAARHRWRRTLSDPVIGARKRLGAAGGRSEEHTSELQSLMRISYSVSCLKKKQDKPNHHTHQDHLVSTNYKNHTE